MSELKKEDMNNENIILINENSEINNGEKSLIKNEIIEKEKKELDKKEKNEIGSKELNDYSEESEEDDEIVFGAMGNNKIKFLSK